ncbi:MAG: T9SS type A sorting domain-containing protein, partial [Candidatus Cloacimonadaceae bacterium]|nr:T9SS type A sorting domain-containing protein [Candidatus Cloacimonadaceae bacterium]
GGGEPGWLHYDSGSNNDSIGTGAVADFDVAAKWDPAGTYGINPWVGMNITKIKFWPNEVNCQYSVRVWTGAAATMVVDQPVTNPVIGAWNEIILNTPFTIPAGTYLWAGYRNNTQGGYPAGSDAGPQVEGYGNMIRLGGSWSTLTALAPSLTYNWNIQIYVADANGREYVLGQLPQNEQITSGTLAASGITNVRQDRDVSAYKIYRDEVFVAEVPGTTLTYTDNGVNAGLHTYYVTAMYGPNESLASNRVTVFITPANLHELMHDDGTAESGYSVGATRQMAVKYQYPEPVLVHYVKVYVHTVNTAGIIVRVWTVNPTDGMPGDQLLQFQYPASSVAPGWNYVTLPEGVLVPNGQFFVGIMETTNACLIGLDNSSNGNSYKRIAANPGWEPLTEGELMIRPIVEPTTSTNGGEAPALTLNAANYPNPFNPVTTISYTVPNSGVANITIYNMKGQVVRNLVNSNHAAGSHTAVWNGLDESGKAVSSGLYFYRLSSNNQVITKKMLLAK